MNLQRKTMANYFYYEKAAQHREIQGLNIFPSQRCKYGKFNCWTYYIWVLKAYQPYEQVRDSKPIFDSLNQQPLRKNMFGRLSGNMWNRSLHRCFYYLWYILSWSYIVYWGLSKNCNILKAKVLCTYVIWKDCQLRFCLFQLLLLPKSSFP